PGISEKMLVSQLRELEKDGIVKRTVFAEVPPKVEYELTDIGRSMKPMLASISEWGMAHKASDPLERNDIDPQKLSERLDSSCGPSSS
ncbi:MAG TPA: winged helix-turn-helix transcriptional regulator, partial [Cytophagales bacterium]|nr:winged helix-turn-helix transcriptional regulator [Cytophagales bacterium]